MIEVKNLNKVFTKTLKSKGLRNFLKKEKKEYIAVNNISFNVKRGEIVAFVRTKWSWKKYHYKNAYRNNTSNER